jgi:hypothetical protein
MIQEIKLSDDVSIYKTQIELENINQLISDIKLNLDISLDAKKPTPTEPGIQAPMVISTTTLSELNSKIIDVIFDVVGVNKSTPYTTHQWTYISENTNKYFGFHTHTKKLNTNIIPKWTYTYYAQMPDVLIEDDGKLVFKLNNGNTHMILPMVGDLIIFPTTLLHAPMNNSNSNLERIVLAGVWSDIDINTKLRKKDKTLF